MAQTYERAADYLLKKVSCRPQIGIICGSGLAGLSSCIQDPTTVVYADIPGFPATGVQGHTGELVFGNIGGIEVVCMRGRFHYYEGRIESNFYIPN